MPQSKRKRGASPATDSKELNDKKEDSGAERKVKGRRKAAASGRSDSNEKPKEEYHFWLMKSEPESRIEKGMDMKFGIEDLKAQPDQRACWDGVRNYQVTVDMSTLGLLLQMPGGGGGRGCWWSMLLG
ncbi:unnamed protein product [Staurois parvus]|uniref:Thymocyte nuclear protein 1 n=1 Tax=Staurois parvus TaxID=386267 RepID=A0ABN9HWT3_9NEOB|nr:unnamed protein product [Staurois parvus]